MLGELTEPGWLDPLAGFVGPREREKEGTRMRRGIKHKEAEYKEREGKGTDRAMEGEAGKKRSPKGKGVEPERGRGTCARF